MFQDITTFRFTGRYYVPRHYYVLLHWSEIVPLEEVFQTLRCDSNGLTIESAERLSHSGKDRILASIFTKLKLV
ncbi:hypothetical protein JHK87_039385 [Glycine soja]|nr:hypothetical protein JHK87_039385 [Glycine soja]